MKVLMLKHKGGIVLIGSILVILLLITAIAARIMPELFASAKEILISFLQDKAEVLPQAIADAKGRYINKQDADTNALQSLFWFTQLHAVDGRNEDGIVHFHFDWTYNLGETTTSLVYIPANEYPSPESDDQKLVKEEENAWRWEGGGVNGKGYIDVERLADKWFYVESYYPT